MQVVTIPQKLAQGDDLVVVPRKEYEALLQSRINGIKEVSMNKKQKLAMKKGRENLAKGKFLTIHELKRKLGSKN